MGFGSPHLKVGYRNDEIQIWVQLFSMNYGALPSITTYGVKSFPMEWLYKDNILANESWKHPSAGKAGQPRALLGPSQRTTSSQGLFSTLMKEAVFCCLVVVLFFLSSRLLLMIFSWIVLPAEATILLSLSHGFVIHTVFCFALCLIVFF